MAERQRTYRTQAVILRRRDYQDADRVLTVFTPDAGKQELIAKGIRKTSSRKAGHLELFTHASLLVAKARTWDIVTEAVTVESFRHLRENLDDIGRAAYVCELIDSFTEADDESQPLWDLLLLALRELDQHAEAAQKSAISLAIPSDTPPLDVPSSDTRQVDVQLLMRWVELHLLGVSGFQPQLYTCLGSGNELQEETNYLSISESGVFSPQFGKHRADAEPIEPDVLKVLRFLQRSRWSEARGLSVRPMITLKIENILHRMLLAILERQLKSVDFMRKLTYLAAG